MPRRAEVNKVGDGWGLSATHAVADDPKLHLPFDKLPPAPPPEPPPRQPTEAEHRAALADAIAAQARADEAVTKASETHDRAIALVAQRRQELANLASLDSDRFARTLDSLRDDDGFQTVPGEDDRLVKRETARLNLEDAESAEAILLADRAVLATAAGNAAATVDRLAVAVLSHRANAIADQHNECLRQAAVLKDTLHAFSHFSANSGGLSGKVSSILLADGRSALAKLRDKSGWRAARDKLLADPQAEITTDLVTPTNTLLSIPGSRQWPPAAA
jgi:hypothetical protein